MKALPVGGIHGFSSARVAVTLTLRLTWRRRRDRPARRARLGAHHRSEHPPAPATHPCVARPSSRALQAGRLRWSMTNAVPHASETRSAKRALARLGSMETRPCSHQRGRQPRIGRWRTGTMRSLRTPSVFAGQRGTRTDCARSAVKRSYARPHPALGRFRGLQRVTAALSLSSAVSSGAVSGTGGPTDGGGGAALCDSSRAC